MKKRHFIISLTALLFSAITVFAIPPATDNGPGCGHDKDWKERIKAEKIAYFTDALELTPEEAQVFWPIYNKLQDEREKYHGEARKSMKLLEIAIETGKTETEIATLLDNYLEAAGNCDNMREKTREEISKVLSEEKTAMLFLAEERFMMKQFRNLKNRKE